MGAGTWIAGGAMGWRVAVLIVLFVGAWWIALARQARGEGSSTDSTLSPTFVFGLWVSIGFHQALAGVQDVLCGGVTAVDYAGLVEAGMARLVGGGLVMALALALARWRLAAGVHREARGVAYAINAGVLGVLFCHFVVAAAQAVFSGEPLLSTACGAFVYGVAALAVTVRWLVPPGSDVRSN